MPVLDSKGQPFELGQLFIYGKDRSLRVAIVAKMNPKSVNAYEFRVNDPTHVYKYTELVSHLYTPSAIILDRNILMNFSPAIANGIYKLEEIYNGKSD